MAEIITSPVTREALGKFLLGVAKLGVIAAASVLAGKVFREATDEFIAVTAQDFNRIKDMVA